MEIAHLAECDSHFQETGIRDYRIKLVFLLPAPPPPSLLRFGASIFISSAEREKGQGSWAWVEREGDIKTRNHKALYGVNVRITTVPAAYQAALKKAVQASPISFPLPAHPIPCDAKPQVTSVIFGCYRRNLPEQGERLRNWTDSNIIWAMVGLVGDQSRVMKRFQVKSMKTREREMCIYSYIPVFVYKQKRVKIIYISEPECESEERKEKKERKSGLACRLRWRCWFSLVNCVNKGVSSHCLCMCDTVCVCASVCAPH